MIVVDVETTGTDPQKHSIISIGAIDMNAPSETFYLECRMWDGAHVEPAGMEVNGMSVEGIKDLRKPEEGEAVTTFFEWLKFREDGVIGAQNPLFDLGFLQAASKRHHIDFRLAHRSIDLHTVTYMHMVKRGLTPPVKNKRSDINSDSIMAYVGIPAEPKPHIAINGAVWEAEAFSRLFFDKVLLEKFSTFRIPWMGLDDSK